MGFVLPLSQLDELFTLLKKQGYELVGPKLQEGAIIYDEIHSSQDLPQGFTDEQEAGTYRVKKRNDQALFGYNVGPHSWKKYLHPPVRKLWSADRTDSGFTVQSKQEPAPRYAFIGVRACEIQAIQIQDRVFIGETHQDPSYQARRKNSFIVAVNCGQAGPTCFCVSMEAGPKVTQSFDLALTEILKQPEQNRERYFLVEVGSEAGQQVLDQLSLREASPQDKKLAEQIISKTAQQMGRQVDTKNIKETFYQNYEHPRWDEVAERCLTCANCTMVCPTCFCTTVEDVTDLTGEHTERWQQWDSCFTMDFSHLNGVGSVRGTTRARYRQWLTHKLATWIDQFGTSGCVGCGRCITWCPVGIDLTEETAALQGRNS